MSFDVSRQESDDAAEARVFFDELLAAACLEPDYRLMYDRLGETFSRVLFQSTNFVGMRFSGPFARTDYLLKENDATTEQARLVNDMRVRLRQRATLTTSEMRENRRHDLKAIAVLVSLAYKADIPKELKTLFPVPRRHKKASLALADVVRMVVDSWDDDFIYGRVDDQATDDVRVRLRPADGDKQDWSYLKDYLGKGAQLNLVRPRLANGTVEPDLIIFEPDMLIDVSAIAKCFTDYGATALTYLLSKISPQVESPATTLGNLASQLLDEEVHHEATENSFNGSIRQFYSKHALSLITSGAAQDRTSFYQEALNQRRNISNAINQELPRHVAGFSRKDVVLEPSFLSEMLGLQGRMDFLTIDKSMLIEQKSGRCGFPQSEPNTPVHTVQHYVQVLLYMLIIRYNYRTDYERNKGLRSFLLYSKYANSLLGEGFAPELVFKAIRMRNEIAWRELLYDRKGFHVLDELTPESFLQNQAKSRFFDHYIRPSIDRLLTPIHEASTLERAYFYRYMRFVESEHILSKIGSQTKANTGFASTWNASLNDKLQAGNIYDKLTMESLPTDEKIEALTLRFKEDEDNDMSNFRVGDVVILYPYGKDSEPDARRTIVFRCTIEEIKADNIMLRLRAPQSDHRVFSHHGKCYWAIEHDFIESSYSSLYRGLHAFLTAPRHRRDLILLQRKPQTNSSLTLKGDYGDFNDLVLRAKQAKDFYLIMGPPGTGKTSFGLLNILREELLEEGTSVLLLSFTNRAVDEICSKLQANGIDFIRMGGDLSCAPEYRSHLLAAKAAETPRLADLETTLRDTRVYVGTTTAANSSMGLFKLKRFSLAIIDEASQILEPHIIGLLSACHGEECAIRKFILIGDHKQLPAVVQQNKLESVVANPELRAIGLKDCRDSLFQRLYEAYCSDSRSAYMLTRQGRMHREIAAFPNRWFYGNKLKEVPLAHQEEILPTSGTGRNGIDDLLTTRRVAFIAVNEPSLSGSDKVNQDEAEVIAALVYRIYLRHKDNFLQQTVGVIVPYRNQIATIRNAIAKTYHVDVLNNITIDTVERYQGSQRDYIIYGFTIRKPYQINFLTSTNFIDNDGNEIDRKLNVAMTRAMRHLLLIGNATLLSGNAIYNRLIEHAKRQGSYFNMGKEAFVKGLFNVPAAVQSYPE